MTDMTFICGFIGSGKTTYANKLAQQQGALRFSIDEWMIPLYGEHMSREDFDRRLAVLQDLFKQAALQLHALKVPVIFDFGFWTQRDRQQFTLWAQTHGMSSEIHYLATDFAICRERALWRNTQDDGKSYTMTPEMLDLFWSWFEPPFETEAIYQVDLESD